MHHAKRLFLVILAVIVLHVAPAKAVEYQWSVLVPHAPVTEGVQPRAYLWIPPTTRQLRGVLVGQHNLLEETIFENAAFRTAMQNLNVGIIWITPGFDLAFRTDKGAGDLFNNMMTALAEQSGYSELTTVGILPIGHSAAAGFPSNFAYWAPHRTIASLSIKGSWPDFRAISDNQIARDPERFARIPHLVINGEYEWAKDRQAAGLKIREQFPRAPVSFLADAGAGHFDAPQNMIDFLAAYIKGVMALRVPEVGDPSQLKPIDATRTGWLADSWRGDDAPKAPPAPAGSYSGPPAESFWYPNESLAKAVAEYGANYRGKKFAVVGYMQNGQLLPQNPNAHQQVTIRWQPAGDGMTIKLTGAFETTVPEGRPERWTGLPKGSAAPHPQDADKIKISVICGPMIQTASDTFVMRYSRAGMDNLKRANDVWMLAEYPGDQTYKRSIQQSLLKFPRINTRGADQTITFPPLPAVVKAGSNPIELNATASSNLPVSYYVREGPAEIVDNKLVIKEIPPRTKLPIQITVIAWQWGRSVEPLIKSAPIVEQTIKLEK